MVNERKLNKSELKKREGIIIKMKDNKRDLVKKYGKDAETVMYGRATNMAKKQTKEMRDPKLTELIKNALKNPNKADLNKDGKLSDYEKTRGSAIEKNLKETRDDYAQMMASTLIDALGTSSTLENLVSAMSTDDARLYLGAIMRDYDIDNPMDMNLDNLEEAELPSSIIQKLANEIKDPQGLAKAMLGVYNAIQDKEQKDYSKNQKFGRVLNYLNDIIDDKAESVKEDFDLGHEDNEPQSLKSDLYRIGKYAMDLYKIVDQFDDGGEIDFPSWWQSKIFKAKDALVGAKHYLDFEINEPKIDAVVNIATDVVDEDINQLGTDDDTGFQASLYTPNEMGAGAVERESASGAFEENKEPIKETMNMNKWRRAYNGKAFAKKIVYLEDYNGNKKRYAIYFKYKETPSKDVVFLKESYFGNHEGSGMPFAMSNLQNKPTYLFTSDDKMEFDTEEQFDDFVDDGAKGLESLLSFFLGGKNVDNAIKAWFDTGVTDKSKMKIGPAEYFEGAKIDESTSKHSNIAEKLAKELKESLPKGYWDKKIDAEDEDQDGKVDESYDTLVNKIKKQGKSSKAAKAIAGAVASYKAKGGGKGPTAKQK